MKSILDPSFQYTPSLQTDVRKTFDRVRREHDEASRDDIAANPANRLRHRGPRLEADRAATMTRTLLALALLVAGKSFAAEPELGLVFARSTKSKETDIVRLTYRQPLPRRSEWWMPSSIQLGTSLWRVPGIGGSTQRFDINATPIWRLQRPWGYVEAGIGGYLLSKTINNDANRLPSSFQFGSHVGAGVRIGEKGHIGVAIQYLSNAGLKQPNGGIDLIALTGGIQF